MSIDGVMRGCGKKPGDLPWTVAIERPDRSGRQVVTTIGLQDAALATSGVQHHHHERDGRGLPHTIDPRTGRLVDNGLASVTVLAPTCMEAVARAKALHVMGPERGREFAAAQGIEALFMTRGGPA